MMKKQLQELEKNGICDKETYKVLSKTKDTFVRERIKTVIALANDDSRWEQEDEYTLGRRLLFLEELLNAPQDQQTKIKEWLQDEKRLLLFDYSPQAGLYGDLLFAKARGTLDNVIRDHNPKSNPQDPFVFQRELILKDIQMTMGKEMIDRKVESVISGLQEKIMKPIYKALEQCFDSQFLERLKSTGVQRIYAGDTVVKTYKEAENFESAFNSVSGDIPYEEVVQMRETIIRFYDTINRSKEDKVIRRLRERAGVPLEVDERPAHEVEKEIREEINRFEEVHITEKLENIVQSIQGEDIGLEEEIAFFDIRDETSAEIDSLRQAYKDMNEKRLSEKLEKAKTLKYTLELNKKDPLDVRFGNDGGCCIGIYKKEFGNIGNAYGLPSMIADNAVYIFNIMQQINERTKNRVGIVLAFNTATDDKEPILACNSLELSPSMNPTVVLDDVVSYCEEGLTAFGRENGFVATIMSNHKYNTSRNYSAKSKNIIKKPSLKIKGEDAPFYSEILNRKGMVQREDRFYAIYDDRKQ